MALPPAGMCNAQHRGRLTGTVIVCSTTRLQFARSGKLSRPNVERATRHPVDKRSYSYVWPSPMVS